MGNGTTSPPSATWTRLVFVYDPTQGLTVFEDGQQLHAVPAITGALAAKTQVILGVAYEYDPTTATEAFQAEIDNVVIWNE